MSHRHLIRCLPILGLAALLVVASPADAGETFTIDTAHSSVSFKVKHMVVSKVRGAFTSFEGTIKFDEEDRTRSSVAVTIEVTSIDTANADRDTHLRSADFFDADKQPEITFRSTGIEAVGAAYVAHGELAIKGVKRPVSLPFMITGRITDPWGNERLGVEVEPVTIDRRDYGLSWSKSLDSGGLVVGNEVTIEIVLEAVKVKPATDA